MDDAADVASPSYTSVSEDTETYLLGLLSPSPVLTPEEERQQALEQAADLPADEHGISMMFVMFVSMPGYAGLETWALILLYLAGPRWRSLSYRVDNSYERDSPWFRRYLPAGYYNVNHLIRFYTEFCIREYPRYAMNWELRDRNMPR